MLLEKSDRNADLYRRPGIVSDGGSQAILYYEHQDTSPPARQTLYYRMTTDGGNTWSDRNVLFSGGATGMVHNLMMAYADGIFYSFWNIQYRQLWCSRSKDGLTWEEPRDLTRMLWRAESEYPWNAFGIGSGHCVRLSNGRILIPTWFTTGGDGHKPSAFANIYSDDGFQTVQIGAMLQNRPETPIVNPNEGAIVELDNGNVLATGRHDGTCRARAFAVSAGGVGPWHTLQFRTDLPDPICHASLQRLQKDGRTRILFCNCCNADPGAQERWERGLSKYPWSEDARKNLTLRVSDDQGQTFSAGIPIAQEGGYSDLAVCGDQILCIYETNWNAEDGCIYPRGIGLARIAVSELGE